MSETLNMQSTSKPMILAVDDEPANIFTLRCMLESHGYDIHDCGTGCDGVEKARQFSYDLVLLDVMLPDIDGYEVCARIHETKPDLPVILVTALSGSEDLSKGFDAGAVDYVKKPIDQVELLARVQNALRIFQAEARIKTLYNALVEDLETAAGIQYHMLPKTLLRTDHLLYSAAYAPCDALGGDLYDVIRLDEDHCLVYMGDVSGHGIQAALVMSAVKFTINMLIERAGRDIQPYEVMNQLSQTLSNTVLRGAYVTLLLGYMDLQKKTFVYHNAGHPSILLYDLRDGQLDVLDGLGSIPIGWGMGIDYLEEEQDCVELQDNKAIVLYTDGITEYVDEQGKPLEVEGLRGLIASVNQDRCPVLLPHRIKEVLLERVTDKGRDDFSILVLCPTPSFDRRLSCDLMEMARQSGGRLLTRETLLSSVGALCRLVTEQIETWSGDRDLASRADIVIGEILANTVVHGLSDLHGSILVDASFENDTVCLRFVDTGIPWEAPSPTVSDVDMFPEQDLLQESGRGMGIVHSLASSIRRTRICDVNETVITLALQAPDTPS